MIPDIADSRWGQLVTGKLTHQFKSVSAGMCVSRNVRALARENSPEAHETAIAQVHEFFTKFEDILDDDIQALFA